MRINIGRITYDNIGSTKSDQLTVVGKNAIPVPHSLGFKIIFMQLLRKIRNLNHVKGELSIYEVLGKLAHLSNWFRIRNSSWFLVHQSAMSPSSTPRISSFSFEFSCSFLYSLLRSGYPDGQYDN